ncbi:radical S-adenosyl methionine-containing protein 2 [Drechslerella stenobrocha 248]|uniref:Radical S-adenosyl methionine-containing protein 2 n=1 Tax=Drechslerella stenobrocha 248 TaxID=1043628 RepID=W7IBD2_9PEZI|nr:radical S-adenosyl methionine-containing protein 2 [Drechslerella stenobrocha 248]
MRLFIFIAFMVAIFILGPCEWISRKCEYIIFVVETKILRRRSKKPISVNYHLTRRCNYACGFCFHTAKTSNTLSLEDAMIGLAILKDAGMRKLNFAGGEPFLEKELLGELMKFCKEALKLESVSVVTNGSLVTDAFLKKYGQYLDIMAVSCDSFNDRTNALIGRGTGKHLVHVRRAAALCQKYGIKFKLNTVVNKYNWNENMNQYIQELKPFRWKCFQCLQLASENGGGDESLRDVSEYLITDSQFKEFCDRHKHNKCFLPENNLAMINSYLILDESMCFLDKDAKVKSQSILDVSVQEALKEVRWDTDQFLARDAIYDWQRNAKAHKQGCGDDKQAKNLE